MASLHVWPEIHLSFPVSPFYVVKSLMQQLSKPVGTGRRTTLVAVERVIQRREHTRAPSEGKQRILPKQKHFFKILLCLCFL